MWPWTRASAGGWVGAVASLSPSETIAESPSSPLFPIAAPPSFRPVAVTFCICCGPTTICPMRLSGRAPTHPRPRALRGFPRPRPKYIPRTSSPAACPSVLIHSSDSPPPASLLPTSFFYCWIEQTQAELARCPRGNVSVDSVVIWCCPVVDTVVSSNVEFEDTHTQSQNLNRLSLMLSERRSIELLNLPLPSSHTHSTSHVLYCNYECHLSPGRQIRRERQFTLPSPHLTEIAPTAELKAPLLPLPRISFSSSSPMP